MSEPPIKELTLVVFTWALANGGECAHARPGCWESRTRAAGRYGPLTVKINPHMHECDGIAPATARVTDDNSLAVGFMNPYGGTLAGFDEGALIDHFNAQATT